MANYFLLRLDTVAPASPTLTIEGGAQYATTQLVNLSMSTSDVDTTGYQMKIWGDVDATFDTAIKSDEVSSTWISYATTKQIKLLNTDGTKNVYLKIRDNVWNESSQVSSSIILDLSMPTANITGPDVSMISKITGKNECSFSFTGSENFVEYKVKLVGTTGAAQDTGTQIPIAGGSSNTSGVGSWSNSDVINCKITGVDLETAGAVNDGKTDSVIKVFIKDSSGKWSA